MPSLFQLNTNVGEHWKAEDESRWEEIKKLIRIDLELDVELAKGLWALLEDYANIFVRNKGELGCCIIGEHMIDIQGVFCVQDFSKQVVLLGRNTSESIDPNTDASREDETYHLGIHLQGHIAN